MELVHGSRKASKSALEQDVISSMPDIVVSNIMDCLPIQDAVRTSILSRNWRSKWTMLTQLVLDTYFYMYLKKTENVKYFGRIISRLLLHLKGPITRFELYIEVACSSLLDVVDINHWVIFLSGKGLKEVILINDTDSPMELPTHLFSCLNLEHLELYNFHFRPTSRFCGFPNLLSLELSNVIFEDHKCGEFLTASPLLDYLKLRYNTPGDIKEVEIAKLENLNVLTLGLSELDNKGTITSVNIFRLLSFFPKLQDLEIDFLNCPVLADTEKRVPTALSCLKTLSFLNIDFGSDAMASFATQLICSSQSLETLVFNATYNVDVPPPAVSSPELDCSRMGKMRLQKVELDSARGLKNELCLMKSLLAWSPFLKEMIIRTRSSEVLGGDHGEKNFATKLLKLHRASPVAEIDLIFQ